MRISVCVVDDDPLVASSLKTIISTDARFHVCRVEFSGEAAINAVEELRPDIVLMDIRMGGISGIEAGQRMLKKSPQVKILFLTTFSDDEYIVQALKMGAAGYLLKQNYDSIIPALDAVYLGQRVFGEAVADKIPGLIQNTHSPSCVDLNLTEREYMIMQHVAQGLSNKEISDVVYLGEGTVRNYVSTILEKLNLRDRTQLAVFYYKNFV